MHEFIGLESLFVFLVLSLYMFSAAYLPQVKVKVIHQTGIAVLLGLLAGLVVKVATNQAVQFDEGPFFYFILPPIVFSAGYNMKRKRFFKNIGYIASFGLIGTVLAFVVNTYMAYAYNEASGLGLSDREVLVLGAALSATDTVAGLTIVSEKEAPKLHSVLFGEGVVNDAVAIILFKSIMESKTVSLFDASALSFTVEVLENCVLSCALGLAFGVGSALIFKVCEALSSNSIHEISLLFFMANIAYITAEFLGLSGVIALLICAIVMAHYTWYNLSSKAKSGSAQSFQLVGEICESVVFVYLGLCTFGFLPNHWSLGLVFYMVFAVLLSRAVGILLLSGLLK